MLFRLYESQTFLYLRCIPVCVTRCILTFLVLLQFLSGLVSNRRENATFGRVRIAVDLFDHSVRGLRKSGYVRHLVSDLRGVFVILITHFFGFLVPDNKDAWKTGLNNVKEHLKMMGRARQTAAAATQQAAAPNRYCACSDLMCNCCRDFSLPVVPIKGPGKHI